MSAKKPIDVIGGWDWETLVASWRYYEHGGSITAASFMEDIVERFFKDTKTYSDKARMQIANQFANIDHGLRGEEDWTRWGGGDDSAAKSWRKFYRFCEAWANNQKPHSVVNYVFTHPLGWLYDYHLLVLGEMDNRGYKYDPEWLSVSYRGKRLKCDNSGYMNISHSPTYNWLTEKGVVYPEHNDEYLKECLKNLEGKGIKIDI